MPVREHSLNRSQLGHYTRKAYLYKGGELCTTLPCSRIGVHILCLTRRYIAAKKDNKLYLKKLKKKCHIPKAKLQFSWTKIQSRLLQGMLPILAGSAGDASPPVIENGSGISSILNTLHPF